MKKNIVILIDLTKGNVWEQIDAIERKMNKTPWYKRFISWLKK